MTGELDAMTALAFFIAMCAGCAVFAWIADALTKVGTRKLDQARRDLYDQERDAA